MRVGRGRVGRGGGGWDGGGWECSEGGCGGLVQHEGVLAINVLNVTLTSP